MLNGGDTEIHPALLDAVLDAAEERPGECISSTRNLDTAAALGRAVGVGAARVFWHAYLVDGSSPKKHEPEPGVPDSVRSDGRAAIAVTLLALFLIGFLISRLV